MANFYAKGRSNYFKVADVAKFKALCEKYRLESWEEDKNERYAFTPSDEGGLQSDPSPDELFDMEIFVKELSSVLQDGEVAVYQEVGSEKLRYLVGWAVAIHSDGRTVTVDLGDIFSKAGQEFQTDAEKISQCCY